MRVRQRERKTIILRNVLCKRRRWLLTQGYFPLVNEVSPVTALVSDSGNTITFDNWHSVGYGDDGWLSTEPRNFD